jgi:hypothetical protein
MTETRTICTIIAKNYVAHARVLAESFLAKHPAGKCFVLVVDDYEGCIDPAQEVFDVIGVNELQIPNVRSFCFKYNVTELATALKASFLRFLLERREVRQVLYLDPDILVTSGLDELFERLNRAPLLLTPHLDQDYPNDGRFPNDSSVLRAGIFNLGFLGLAGGPWATGFLRWLEEKLSDSCVVDPAGGYFVDQRFFDIALSTYPEIEIERGVGYNVAYWNLHSRFLTFQNGTWLCNGEPLRFFHFSNYYPETPDSISGHTNRYKISDRPDLAPLFDYYRAQLLGHGYEKAKSWPYSFNQFANGVPISEPIRREYRKWSVSGHTVEDPFASKALMALSRKLVFKEKVNDGLDEMMARLWRMGGKLSRRSISDSPSSTAAGDDAAPDLGIVTNKLP